MKRRKRSCVFHIFSMIVMKFVMTLSTLRLASVFECGGHDVFVLS